MAGTVHAHPFTYEELYALLGLLVLFWVCGKGAARLRMPALVGEIAVGLLVGPQCFDLAPKPEALMMIGEVGLCLLFLEAGLDVDVEMLQIVGFRGILLSLFASSISLVFGILISYFILGQDVVESFGIGATLAPTSMGIALNVLRSMSVLNTPSGQLIIAAAMLQDVIGIILLAELKASKDLTPLNIAIPIISAVGMIIVFGYLAVAVIPKVLTNKILPRFHHHHTRQNVVLGLIFLATIVLMPASHYAKGSYLLGCFLAGVCFCTDQHTHDVWQSQVKRLLQWLMRIFFACTIGFEVPVRNMGTPKVFWMACVFLLIIFLKLSSGVFALPMSKIEFFKIGFSMVSSCELAFIISVNAWIDGLISDDTFEALILASLASILISPVCLRKVLMMERKVKEEEIAAARKETMFVLEDEDGDDDSYVSTLELAERGDIELADFAEPQHHLYFQLQTKSHGRFGHQDKLLKAIFNIGMSIIDFRSFHPHGDFTVHVVNEMYLKDNKQLVYDTPNKTMEDEAVIKARMQELYDAAKTACDEETAKIKVFRWLPGADNAAHVASPTNAQRERKSSGGQGRDHTIASDLAAAQRSSEANPTYLNGGKAFPAYERHERRSALDHEDLAKQLLKLAYIQAEKDYQKKHKQHTDTYAAMSSHTHPGELSKHDRHHELDGFVHSDPHDAFDPDEIDGEYFSSDSEEEEDDDMSLPMDHNTGEAGFSTPKVAISESGSHRNSFSEGDEDDDVHMALPMVDDILHGKDHTQSVSGQQGIVLELSQLKRRKSRQSRDSFSGMTMATMAEEIRLEMSKPEPVKRGKTN